jgi:hypothetical protein
VRTDRTCYLQTAATTVTVSGTGFAPLVPYTVSLQGAPLGSSMTSEAGALQATFKPTPLADGEEQRASTIAVAADQPATTTFTLTRFSAGFAPTTGDPGRLRVRFSVYGFRLAGGTPTVWLHYVTPSGRLARTLRLGRGQGQCGAIARTRLRRLFPFRSPARGKWRLQFDTAKRYRRGVKGSPFLFYTIGVNVRRSPRS